jgi:hypothetical protein
MFPLEGVIAFLRQLDALGWPAQVVVLAFLLACYVLLLFVARRIGRRNIADLKDENDALKKQVAGSNIKRRELRDKESKLAGAVENLQAQRPEEGLARAAKEREHGNEERVIQLYQELLATFGPDLARCCEVLATADGPEVERYRTLAVRLADIGAQR